MGEFEKEEIAPIKILSTIHEIFTSDISLITSFLHFSSLASDPFWCSATNEEATYVFGLKMALYNFTRLYFALVKSPLLREKIEYSYMASMMASSSSPLSA